MHTPRTYYISAAYKRMLALSGYGVFNCLHAAALALNAERESSNAYINFIADTEQNDE